MNGPDFHNLLRDGHLTFPNLLLALHSRRFTGPVTIHFLRGKPELFQVGTPKKFRLSASNLTNMVKFHDNEE